MKLPLDTRYFKCHDKGFAIPSGRVEFYSEALQRIVQPPLPIFQPPEISAKFPLLMTCAKLPDRCHSQHQQTQKPVGQQRCKSRLPVATLHPATAEKLTITECDIVTVCTPHGTMQGCARLDAALWVHYGWWQAIPGEAPEMTANYTALTGSERDPVSSSALLRGSACRVGKTGCR